LPLAPFAELDAVILSCFEKKSAQELVQQFGISAQAGQNRVVGKQHRFLFKLGVIISTGGFALASSANAAQAASSGLAASTLISADVAGTANQSTTRAIAMILDNLLQVRHLKSKTYR
jgi:hypothetical protein